MQRLVLRRPSATATATALTRVLFVSAFQRSALRGRANHPRHFLSTTPAPPSPTPSPLPTFTFGLIADIQYVDADDATNFSGTTQRFYRHSFRTYQDAVRYWGTLQPAPACALVLGDILDGKTAQLKNQEECIGRILEASRAAPCPVYYCYGNHEHYAFGRPDIHDKVCGGAAARALSHTLTRRHTHQHTHTH